MGTNSSRPLEVPLTGDEFRQFEEKSFIVKCLLKIKFPRIEWTWMMGVRVFIIIGTVIGMIFNTIYGLAMPSTDIECVLDKTFVLTSFLNSFLTAHSTARKCFIILTSLYTDCMIVYSLLHWAFRGKSLRLLFSLSLFYIVQTVIRLFFFVEYPPNYLWEYPSFPSIFVSYVKTPSLFFTNCVGLLMICLMEWKANGHLIQMAFTLVCIVLECFIMHSLRAHYVIDLFSGLFIGHYVFIVVDMFAELIDKVFHFREKEDKPPSFDSTDTSANISLATPG